MSTLEDTVRLVVQDFISREVLFTALDVSNAVKQSVPQARHREVRDVVRSMFNTEIETQGWARTPITVTLTDGTTAEALLYHPLTDSWDLDNKYSTQQRQATASRPVLPTAPAVVSPATTQTTTGITGLPLNNPPAQPVAPVPAPLPTARTLWDQLFQTQPSLFPRK